MDTSLLDTQLGHLTDEAFVHHVFITHLKRTCLPAQARYYLRVLESGSSRFFVWKEIQTYAFLESKKNCYFDDELLKGIMSLEGEIFVTESYRYILGRDVDPSGLKNYITCLEKGDGKAHIIYSLLISDEGKERSAQIPFLSKLTNKLSQEVNIKSSLNFISVLRLIALDGDAFINSSYKTILGREADSDGKEFYRKALNKGVPKINILISLAESKEGFSCPKTWSINYFFIIKRFFKKVIAR